MIDTCLRFQELQGHHVLQRQVPIGQQQFINTVIMGDTSMNLAVDPQFHTLMAKA